MIFSVSHLLAWNRELMICFIKCLFIYELLISIYQLKYLSIHVSDLVCCTGMCTTE